MVKINKLNNPKITTNFLKKSRENFYRNPLNLVARNAVASVGALNASIDTDTVNKISHVFLNSVKPEHLRATDQESSGRCWMFAGLNVFRYILIKALKMDNFEFSETYLFFYDKLERANYVLQYFIDTNPIEVNGDISRITDCLLKAYTNDGGYWNYFSNLVEKYGLVPKEAMPETFHSGWTSNMNDLLNERVLACCNQMMKSKSSKSKQELKEKTMIQVYEALVKFLGPPPEKFDWSFRDTDKKSQRMFNLTPISFKNMILSSVKSSDFVVLMNIPCKEYYKNYLLKTCNNVVGGNECIILNLPIEDLKKYAVKTIEKGLPVWFAGDVNKGFGYHKAVLNEKIFNTDLLFGPPLDWNKSEKVKIGYTSGCHAMTITGVNFDESGKKTISWQVENSWGYADYEQPGLDGFLTMSDEWFTDNLIQLVVHKQFLDYKTKELIHTVPIQLDPWDSAAPALFIKGKTN